jgi:membrane protein YdbS with pleckstrin-like domain
MIQAIAGVAPPGKSEVTAMVVWPSNAATGLGRFLGQLYAIDAGVYVFTIGNFIALASIPIALAIYFLKVLPIVGTRYRLTNRRLVVERGWSGRDERSVDLDRFDAVDIEVRPGQAWYSAGDLVFKLGKTETFRLEGVSRPEAFRQCLLKAQRSHVGVKKALAEQMAMA